jgi:NADH-quinone oxidoreductase subunit N
LHALSHAIGKAGAFIVVAFIGYMVMKDGGENPGTDSIDDYDGLGKRAPLTALLMTILLFSLAGIPPTFGFYTKFVLFLSAIQAGLLWLAIIAVLNSALSVYYYAKVIMRIYWSEPRGEKIAEPRGYVLAVLLAVAAILILGIYPEPLYKLAMSAAEALTH